MTPGSCVAGIDIGGTNTKLGLVDEAGKLFRRKDFYTDASLDFASYRKQLTEALAALTMNLPSGLLQGVGLGVPGAEGKYGSVPEAANIPFLKGVALRDVLAEAWQLPVVVAKDANAAALGEWHFGQGQGLTHFLTITLGTGLGSGLVIDGKIVQGAHGLAAEFGHSLLVRNGRRCNCGQRGCLETYVSASGLRRTALHLMARTNRASGLRQIPPDQLDARLIGQAADAGDVLARKAIRITANWLGRKMVDIVVLTDPQAIILTGGLIRLGEDFLHQCRQALETHLLPMFQNRVQVLYSQLGPDDAAILGAAALVLEYPIAKK